MQKHAFAFLCALCAATPFSFSQNVGIGTATPTAKLHLAGNQKIDGTNTLEFGAGIAGKEPNAGKIGYQAFSPDALDIVGAGSAGSRKVIFYAEGGTQFNGQLRVLGGTFQAIPSYQYLSFNGTGHFGGATATVGLWVDNRVVAAEFNAISDARIKTGIRTSNAAADLQTLLQLRVTDYERKDSFLYGHRAVKGFIAQEVEPLLPQAVNTQPDFVPDIYSASTSTQYNAEAQTLHIHLHKPHGLQAGDRVRVYAGDGVQERTVQAVTGENSFMLENWTLRQAGQNPVQQVFVWGRQVNDFRSVDYTQLFALGISAIQELARKNAEQQKINARLQQQINALKKALRRRK